MARFRYEQFGGIVHLERPRALVWVDRDYARRLGYAGDERWRGPEEEAPFLSAPLEAHVQLTNRCTHGCQGCYTGASAAGMGGELDEAGWKRVLDELAAMGVFHVALGGGESGELPWLASIARHARSLGIVPNLTTSGQVGDLGALVEIAPLFGQINVSMDGVGEVYARVRGYDGFDAADRAVVALRKATPHVGLNCVVTRQNFEELGALFRYARRRRLRELELLRFKPAGRGAAIYETLRCTQDQHERLLPMVLALARRHRLRVRLDCSYTPMVAHHRPSPRLLKFLALYGCVGGDLLVAAKPHGRLSACSFAAPPAGAPQAEHLAGYWNRSEAFAPFRDWRAMREPCRSCDYLSLCRGGCRVVAAHVTGDVHAPDPECSRVRAFAPHPVRLPVVG